MIILNDDHKKENKIMKKTIKKMTIKKMIDDSEYYEIRSYKVSNKIDNIWKIKNLSFNHFKDIEKIDFNVNTIIDNLFALDNSTQLIEIVYISEYSELTIRSKFRED